MKHLFFVLLTLAALSACNPAHEYYKASGERAKDEKKFQAGFLVCLAIYQPQIERCQTWGPSCSTEDQTIVFQWIPICAEALAGVPHGEFYTDGM